MNTIKRVKILFTLGILANTLCITPIWAQPSNPDPTTAAATSLGFGLASSETAIMVDFLKAMDQAFEPAEEGGMRVTDEARQYAALEVEGDVAIVTFNKIGMAAYNALGDKQRADLLLGVAQSYVDTADIPSRAFLYIDDRSGMNLLTAIITENNISLYDHLGNQMQSTTLEARAMPFANVDFFMAMNQAFVPAEEGGIRVTDEARQYAALEVESDVAIVTFNKRGMAAYNALGVEQRANLLLRVAQSYVDTADSILPSFFSINDAGGRGLATAKISGGEVVDIAWANNPGSPDFTIAKDGTKGNVIQPGSRSSSVPKQSQGSAYSAGALQVN
jgi:hypothetical protein